MHCHGFKIAYWTPLATAANNYLDGTIMKMSLDGGVVTTIHWTRIPDGIAVDAASVYWDELPGC
jgi:hypothetical protein